ncbi:hypothetical protein PG988_008391 [Apiospora saccharicola]
MSFNTRTLEVWRFHRRYYVWRLHTRTTEAPEEASDPESPGAQIVKSIPTIPKKYSNEFEAHIYGLDGKVVDGVYVKPDTPFLYHRRDIPDYDMLAADDVTLPSELPLLAGYKADNVYIINLDDEILTINYGIHWKLNNIPRQDNLWARAGVASIYPNKPTISLDLCSEEHIAASLALPLAEKTPVIGYNSRAVAPRTDIDGARKTLFTYVLARNFVQYKDAIVSFGREWSPNSFPFRELAFAIVSIASHQMRFHSNPPLRFHEQHSGQCDRTCKYCEQDSDDYERHSDDCLRNCQMDHLYDVSELTCDDDFIGCGRGCGPPRAGNILPLLEFCSMSHFPDQVPGVSPTETTYWIKEVLVSLTTVVDGRAITNAVEYGVSHGRTHFQLVVMSLLDVALAEVSLDKNAKLVVRFSESISLSPLRPEYCMSTHPRERPELKPGMTALPEADELLIRDNCTGSPRRLRKYFPGLAALLNFFDVAADRRLVSRSTVTLPAELYDRILDFTDFEAWKSCLGVSQAFRSSCFRKYRLDEHKRIVAGPFVRLNRYRYMEDRVLAFNIEDMKRGAIWPIMEERGLYSSREFCWAPIIGSGERQGLMFDVRAQFDLAWNPRVEDDSEDGDPLE